MVSWSVSGVSPRTHLALHCVAAWTTLIIFPVPCIRVAACNSTHNLVTVTHCIKVHSGVAIYTEVQYSIKGCAIDNKHLSIMLKHSTLQYYIILRAIISLAGLKSSKWMQRYSIPSGNFTHMQNPKGAHLRLLQAQCKIDLFSHEIIERKKIEGKKRKKNIFQDFT